MATAVPSLFVGLLAGVYVDRHDRKRIMIATCLIQAVIVAIIALTVEIDVGASACTRCSCSTPGSSSSSTRPTTASSRRWPATRS